MDRSEENEQQWVFVVGDESREFDHVQSPYFENPNVENPNFQSPAEEFTGGDATFMPDAVNGDDHGYDFDSFPPGYRFKPQDGELVHHYLWPMISKKNLPPNRIAEVELYKFNPNTLTERYKPHGEKEWYFFTPRDRKYPNGERPNRAAGDGYWKATGADKTVKHDRNLVGYKKSLVFYTGKAPIGVKTDWIMHEYRVHNPPKKQKGGNDMRLDDYVLCRVYKKTKRSSEKDISQKQEINSDQDHSSTRSEKATSDSSPSEVPTPPGDCGQTSFDHQNPMPRREIFKPEGIGNFEEMDYYNHEKICNEYEDEVAFFSFQNGQANFPNLVPSNPQYCSMVESTPALVTTFPPKYQTSPMNYEQFGNVTDELPNLPLDDLFSYPAPNNMNF